MDAGFGDDVGVESVTEIDGIDVVTSSSQVSFLHVENKGAKGPYTIPGRCT